MPPVRNDSINNPPRMVYRSTYVNSVEEAVNADGSIKTDRLFEVISEPFRMYQNKELDEKHSIYGFIEEVVR